MAAQLREPRSAQAAMFRGTANIIPMLSHDLTTSCEIDDDLFAAIEFYSEVKAKGIGHIATFNHPASDLDRIYLQFQSFIRQARTFYDAAKTLHSRASPLLYYYFLLNLAKAIITLRQPGAVQGKIGHGLSEVRTRTQLTDCLVHINGGVFPLLYEVISGRPAKMGINLSVGELLGYCRDILMEVHKTQVAKVKSFPAYVVLAVRGNDRDALLMVTADCDVPKWSGEASYFSNFFDEVGQAPIRARELVGIHMTPATNFRVFETTNPFLAHPNIGDDIAHLKTVLKSALGSTLTIDPRRDPRMPNALLNQPYPQNDLSINEFLAIYLSFFFLGSLVRYDPAFLEGLLSTQDSWLIQRFIKSTAVTALRYSVAYLTSAADIFRRV